MNLDKLPTTKNCFDTHILDDMTEEPLKSQMEILQRIIILETKLANTIDRLQDIVKSVNNNQVRYLNFITGDGETPGLHSRLDRLEDFKRTATWALGVLFSALIGGIVTFVIRKI